MCVCSIAQLRLTLQPHELYSTRLLRPWNFPGKNTGVGCYFLLHWILSCLDLKMCQFTVFVTVKLPIIFSFCIELSYYTACDQTLLSAVYYIYIIYEAFQCSGKESAHQYRRHK